MSMEKKLHLAIQLLDFLEERIENSCACTHFDAYSQGRGVLCTRFNFGILEDMTDKEYLEQLEDNLRLVADKVKEFKELVG